MMVLKENLQKLIERYMDSEGILIISAVRDILTDLCHICAEEKLNIDDIFASAKEVAEEEKEWHEQEKSHTG